MEHDSRPAWMSDPLVKDIPEKKLKFVEELFAKGQGKSQKEILTFAMPLLKKAKQENLTFTPQEMNAAIAAIRKHSSTEELTQIDKILEKSRGGPFEIKRQTAGHPFAISNRTDPGGPAYIWALRFILQQYSRFCPEHRFPSQYSRSAYLPAPLLPPQ